MMKPPFYFVTFVMIQCMAWNHALASQFHFVSSTVHFRSGDSAKGLVDEYGLQTKPNRIRFKSNKEITKVFFIRALK